MHHDDRSLPSPKLSSADLCRVGRGGTPRPPLGGGAEECQIDDVGEEAVCYCNTGQAREIAKGLALFLRRVRL